MSREIDVPCFAQCRNLQKTGDASTARCVGLQDIHRWTGEEPTKIVDVIAILARHDVHAGRPARAHQCEFVGVVRADRFLEPSNTYSAIRSANCSARFAGKAPLASTNRPALPIAPRAAATRCGSRSGSLPIFILPSDTRRL